MISDEQCLAFEKEGYVVCRGLVPEPIVAAASDAFKTLVDRAAAGDFGGKFRWLYEEERVPQLDDDLLTPEKYCPEFGEVFDYLLPAIECILGSPVRASWLLLLTGGGGVPYGVPLHRDDNMVGGDDEEESIVRFRMKQSYFQTPLLPNDNFLQVVPGSHLRRATEEERAAAFSAEANPDVTDLVTIELQPGDVVFRHTDLLYQGWNPDGRPRWTMVSALWAQDVPMLSRETKYAQALSEGNHSHQFPPNLRAAVGRYLEAYETYQSAQTASN